MRRRSKHSGQSARPEEADPHGVATEKRARRRRQSQHRLTTEQIDALVAGYERGLTLQELAGSFAIHPRTVARHLNSRAVKIRGRKLSKDQLTRAAQLYESGWSLVQLGKEFGVYPQSIWYRLRRAGFETRPRNGFERMGPGRAGA
jgi:hypothetical protein